MFKKTICIDFDGVIYENIRFMGVSNVRGKPVPGALDAIEKLGESFKILVHSARCDSDEGFSAVNDWLDANGFLSFVDLVKNKPPASVYLDDRAVCFNGDWGKAIDAIGSFTQWQTEDKARNRAMCRRIRRRR